MNRLNLKYIILLVFILVLMIAGSLIIYWYCNPNIKNTDFHLEYQIAKSEINFHNARDKDIEKNKYSYNDDIYYNKIQNYRLTIHSLEYTEKGEKIVIITDYLDHKTPRSANITYKKEFGDFDPIIIKKNKDSIFIIQKLDNFPEDNIMYKGQK